ncbi:hypothetical protein H2198_001575 [Neophaeococcomyces mojaviensis]|uniref:Uncharacterized protein n=1 Tax=Neophaeococcomyces mojaviensis TaxID=3383035 RepID=A0ACC3AGF7_9EURO|nr:hypothetical protein H2198_001575 [Knufia sp. JES_112]
MANTNDSDEQVKPLHGIVPKLYTLSTIDQYVPKRWITRMMYFEISDDVSKQEIFSSLKTSLSYIVTMYPQLTGKMCRQPDKPHWVAVQTEEDGFVRFTLKDHTSPSVDEPRLPPYTRLKELGFPMQGLVTIACPDIMHLEVAEGSPIFAVQANFVHGGLLLTTVLNHILVDGGWWTELFKLWSSFCKELPAAPTQLDEHPMDIVERLSTGETKGKSPDVRNWVVGEAAKSTFFVPKVGTPASSIIHPKKLSSNGDEVKAPVGSSLRIWTITAAKQKELKEAAKAWSTMDAIFACLWNRNAVHKNLNGRGLETVYARMPIDMRSRLTPPVDSSYMGNTVAMLVTEARTAKLQGSLSDSLPSTAQKLRDAIKAYTQEDFAVFIGTANSLPVDKALVQPFPSIFDPCILLNDHSKMGIHTFDWGEKLGKVERLRDPMDDVPVRNLSVCQVMPRLSNDNLEIITLFDHEVNDALQHDEEFLHYFQHFSDAQLWI